MVGIGGDWWVLQFSERRAVPVSIAAVAGFLSQWLGAADKIEYEKR